MLALCWHNMPAHCAFYYASIFEAGLDTYMANVQHIKMFCDEGHSVHKIQSHT